MNSNYRDIIAISLNNNFDTFSHIFDNFRAKLRSTQDGLRIMNGGGELSYCKKDNHFYDKHSPKFKKGLFYPYQWYDKSNKYLICRGIQFEETIKNYSYLYNIKNLHKLYYRRPVMSLKLLTLIENLKPILLKKYYKSKSSLYKLIEKIEHGVVKTTSEKIQAIEYKKKKEEERILKKLQQKKDAKLRIIQTVITYLNTSHSHSIALKQLKSSISDILYSYLSCNQVTLEQFNYDLSIIDNKLTFNKLINYMPNNIYDNLFTIITT